MAARLKGYQIYFRAEWRRAARSITTDFQCV